MDKNKRIEKKKKKGMLKPVINSESAHFVLIENQKCVYDSLLIKLPDYKY